MNSTPAKHDDNPAGNAGPFSTALHGVRVIDLTQFEAGTSCTLMLAWMGAEVIKVEDPKRGEQGRGGKGTSSFYFSLMNANKKSVTCNLKTEEGKEVLRKLIEQGDIFVENFGPGVIERLGFDYDTVKAINPRIIYAQIKGFPDGSEFEKYLSFDMIGQAVGGAMSVTGYDDREPLRAGVTVGDTGTGLHCAIGILGALHQRHSTNEGQRVFVSMQEGVINFGRIGYAGLATLRGEPPPRGGNQSLVRGTSPSQAYPCLGNGPNDYCFVYSSRVSNHHWENLLKVVGREDLLGDPRFASGTIRFEHREAVDEIVSAWTRKHDKWTVMRRLQEAGVPAGAVIDIKELAHDPFLRERGMFTTMTDPTQGEYEMPGNPIRLSASHVPLRQAPPLGADTTEVYSTVLGMDADKIAGLKASGAI